MLGLIKVTRRYNKREASAEADQFLMGSEKGKSRRDCALRFGAKVGWEFYRTERETCGLEGSICIPFPSNLKVIVSSNKGGLDSDLGRSDPHP